MGLVNSLRRTLYRGRAIASRIDREFRPHSVTICTTSEAGTHTGDVNGLDERTAITQADGHNPKVRWLSDEEIAVGGYPSRGVVEIGPITPKFSGGGTDLSVLTGADLQRRDTLQIEIKGPRHPDGMRYRLVQITAEKAFGYFLRAAPIDGGAWP